eukprot:767970-Hanusia_phi.AAC.1
MTCIDIDTVCPREIKRGRRPMRAGRDRSRRACPPHLLALTPPALHLLPLPALLSASSRSLALI